MSLPWNKSVRLRLSPQAVAATLEDRWPRRAQLATASQPGDAFDPDRIQGADGARADGADRARLIDLALLELENSCSLRGAMLHAVLDDSLVHVDVAKGDFAGHSEHQLKAIAQACVAEMLGDAALHREVRWSLQPDEKHLVICAVDREIVGVLGEAAGARAMRMASLQSSFASCWNTFARTQPTAQMVFVVASEVQAVVACVLRRSICALSTGPWRASPASTDKARILDSRVDRLLACMGIDKAEMDGFIAVVPDGAAAALSARWAEAIAA